MKNNQIIFTLLFLFFRTSCQTSIRRRLKTLETQYKVQGLIVESLEHSNQQLRQTIVAFKRDIDGLTDEAGEVQISVRRIEKLEEEIGQLKLEDNKIGTEIEELQNRTGQVENSTQNLQNEIMGVDEIYPEPLVADESTSLTTTSEITDLEPVDSSFNVYMTTSPDVERLNSSFANLNERFNGLQQGLSVIEQKITEPPVHLAKMR